MKIAFTGKGGAGKSLIAGTLCRHLAALGRPVLALDVDTMPGLALSLGMADAGGRLPEGLAARVEGKGWRMRPGQGPARLVDRHAARGPDGIRLLLLGKLPDGVEPSVSVAFRAVMEGFRRPGWALVGDLAAGTRQPMYRWSRFAGCRVVVADPTAKSILSARRLARLGTHLVVNRAVEPGDAEAVERAVGLPLLGTVPFDPAAAAAERRGLAPYDAVPAGPAVAAVRAIAAALIEAGGGR